MSLIIFPASELAPKRCDEYFTPQAEAARECGHEIRFIGLTELEDDSFGSPLRWPALDEPTEAFYRGWMLTPLLYKKMESALRKKNVQLKTSVADYQRAHELPGWYSSLIKYTPRTVELPRSDVVGLPAALSELSAASVWLRDYSKSLKHNLAASFISDATDISDAARVVNTFTDERGSIAGSILLREFEHFQGSEVRSWWLNGALVLLTPHPDTPTSAPVELDVNRSGEWLPEGFSAAISSLALPFVTADFTLRSDGVWRLVELGDGQVSDVPSCYSLSDFYETLL